MKKDIEKLLARIAELEKQVEALKQMPVQHNHHYHNYPPVVVNPAPIYPPLVPWCGPHTVCVATGNLQ